MQFLDDLEVDVLADAVGLFLRQCPSAKQRTIAAHACMVVMHFRRRREQMLDTILQTTELDKQSPVVIFK